MWLWVVSTTVFLLFLFKYTLEDLYLIYIKGFPPGPLSLPLIGGLHHLDLKKPHISLFQLSKKYNGGMISLRMGPTGRVVFLNDLKIIQQVTRLTSAANRPELPYFDLLTKDTTGIGSAPYCTAWKIHTKLFHDAIVHVSNTALEDIVNDLLPTLFRRFDSNQGSPFDPTNDLKKLTINLLSQAIYGHHYNNWDDPEMQETISRNDFLMLGLAPYHPINIIPWLKSLPIPMVTKILKCIEKRDAILNKEYEQHFEADNGHNKDVLDIVARIAKDEDSSIKLTDKQKQLLTVNNMSMSIYTLFMAGTSTLHETFRWMFLYLGQNPEVLQKCQEELDQGNTKCFLSNRIHFPYTEAVIYELLRITSVAGNGMPRVGKEDIHIDQYTVPKNTIMFPNQWHIHHSDISWEEPHKFKPERFLDSDGHLLATETLKKLPFIVFGTGIRTCIGRFLAMNILFQFTSSFVHSYNIKHVHGDDLDMDGQLVSVCLRASQYKVILEARPKIKGN